MPRAQRNYMYKYLLFFLMVPALFAYTDSDLDGVDDTIDQCPNTSIMDLVDTKGCSIESLQSQHHYDIVIGGNYSQMDYTTNEKTDTYTSTLQVDYFYKAFSLQASTSYFSSKSDSYSDSGLNDSTLSAGYSIDASENLRIKLGIGLILPTYNSALNNNKMDYLSSINATYSIDKLNLFAGYSFTVNNDKDIANVVAYQDAHAYSAGLGYYLTSKWYMSTSYYNSDSTTKNIENIENVSLYSFYSIDEHWFTNITYAYGLSDSTSKHYASLNIGYYF